MIKGEKIMGYGREGNSDSMNMYLDDLQSRSQGFDNSEDIRMCDLEYVKVGEDIFPIGRLNYEDNSPAIVLVRTAYLGGAIEHKGIARIVATGEKFPIQKKKRASFWMLQEEQ